MKILRCRYDQNTRENQTERPTSFLSMEVHIVFFLSKVRVYSFQKRLKGLPSRKGSMCFMKPTPEMNFYPKKRFCLEMGFYLLKPRDVSLFTEARYGLLAQRWEAIAKAAEEALSYEDQR